uniref:Carbonyl reductase 1 n=1 Tax=Bos indicus x Bos taurus TaxID=30522 RepID=A0A4W2G3G4_BOBOX
MSSSTRVALVNGANKCLGFAIVRDLCRQFPGKLVLMARGEAFGRAATQQLQTKGPSPLFHQLDITALQSIRALRDFLRKEYRGLVALVNNAAIAFQNKFGDPTPIAIQAEVTMKTNVLGTRALCTELLPLIKSRGRVVNVSSAWGFKKLRSETIMEEELVGLMNKFVEDTKNGVHRKEGWPDNNIHEVAKIGIMALSRIQARKLSEQRGGDKILLNACCPGPQSLEEGIEIPVYLALLPSDAEGPHGQFVHEKKVAKWQFLPEFYP